MREYEYFYPCCNVGLDILATMHYVKREPRLLLVTETGAGTALLAPLCTVTEAVLPIGPVSVAMIRGYFYYLEVAIAPQKQDKN